MKQSLKYILIALLPLLNCGCYKNPTNPNITTFVDFEINLNQSDYYKLNFMGNFVYVTGGENSNSWGIIIFRMPSSDIEFRAYDRFPPNNPFACQDEQGNYKRLTTDGYFVIDSCNNIKYNILDGSIFEGDGQYELIQYRCSYNQEQNTLHVSNFK